MYIGLTVIAFHILIIGPIKDLVKHETTFTESLQNINGKIYEILGSYYNTLSCYLFVLERVFLNQIYFKLEKKSSMNLIFLPSIA